MIFGIREKKTSLGKFTSDKCSACKKSIEYRMEKTVQYFVVLGINLVPLHMCYESVCDKCGIAKAVKGRTARGLARKHFAGRQLKQQFFMGLRLVLAAAVIAAAVVLPLTIKIPLDRDPEVLKALVSADGNYAIHDSSGEVLAVVNVTDGVKTLTWYDKVSVLSNTGSKGGTFYLHETYQEAADSQGNTILTRFMDDPGRLLDQYKSVVRVYFYNQDMDALGFYKGVEDLSTIHYTARKVTYPSIYYLSEDQKEGYLQVLYLMSNAQVRIELVQSEEGVYDQVVSVYIDTIEGGVITDQVTYYFDDDIIALAQQEGLTADSQAQDFVDFIIKNGVSAVQTYHYEHYRNTGVVVSEQSTLPDEDGVMQTYTVLYDVTAKDGYYIAQMIEGGGQ